MGVLKLDVGPWICAAVVLCLCSVVGALRTLDDLQPIKHYSRRTSDEQLRSSLAVSCSILQRHNEHLDSQPLEQYIKQLKQVLQQGCCDYFTALPLVKDLTDGLKEVLEWKLPQDLQPVVRRSYVCAVWLLQRSKLFRWNSKYMHKVVLQGLFRCDNPQ